MRTVLGAAFALVALHGDAGAQSYPAQPIHVLVGFAAGGGTDILARFLAQAMGAQRRSTIIVDTRRWCDVLSIDLIICEASAIAVILAAVSGAVPAACRPGSTVTPPPFEGPVPDSGDPTLLHDLAEATRAALRARRGALARS